MTSRSARTRSSARAATPRWCASTASKKALAITTDCTPRYCYADPYEGGKQAVAEAYRNLCAVGARPLAITNCLNFGNPQRPEIMGQFVGCVEGMAEACRALDFPVVSGNVSLYNETKSEDGASLAILPTPAIGGVGLLDDWEKSATIAFKARGRASHVSSDIRRQPSRPVAVADVSPRPPGRPAAAGRPRGRKRGSAKCIRNAHRAQDWSRPFMTSRTAALLVAVAEMALAGGIGRAIGRGPHADASERRARLFGEDQGRYVVTVTDHDAPR